MNGSGNGTGSRASRRPHTKSRNGCGQCKKRKVKCDERAPRCSNCTKWRDLCDYELFGLPTCNPAGKRKQSKDAQSGAGMTISRSYPQPPAPSPSQINLEHLELMHHYSTSTARTFHDFGDGGHRWEIIVPGQAQSYEFLMHALLGVSALHIVHLKGNDPSASLYLSRARAHHSEALTLFRSTVSDITQINGIAAAAFSCLFLIFSCGTAQLADAAGNQEPVQDPIDTLFTIVGFFRSYWKLFDTSQQLVEARSPVARNSPSPGVDPQLVPNPAAAAALEELQQLNASSTDSDAMKTIYHDAIAQMQRSLDSGPALPRFLWPLTISDDYLALIEQRQPMALVILAHGCTLTKELPRRWFVHGWILNIILTISERRVIFKRWVDILRRTVACFVIERGRVDVRSIG
ncbi:uncharacterized protein L3040_008635 [Drepanopeziza brunnea f. sp. 'multigermtubi']|uniref:uncharacterized protein n=1 Tax=Drepanopeziza brunnea f. sp. 'multigermtubi' TaxID=698441 RepID=UPI00238DA202|nr:hypothetical protein L3040_008635 [Drepanopeziza brunnea f. sp. 'multigermtubi']